MTHHTSNAPRSLAAEIHEQTGLNPLSCYQCGKCSAGCPMATEMGFGPHKIMRYIQLGRRDRLFEDESIWLCLTCETCTARCPNECDPARVIDCLREMALKEPEAKVPRHIGAFRKAFLEQIKRYGRLFEFGLVLEYKMRSGDLFSDVTSAPGMLVKGKLALSPKKIKGVKDVRRIFDACLTPGDES